MQPIVKREESGGRVLEKRRQESGHSRAGGEGGRKPGEAASFSNLNAQLPDFLTRRELAAVLQVSVRTIDRMAAAGELPVSRVRHKSVRFHLPDVLRRLATGNDRSSSRGAAGL